MTVRDLVKGNERIALYEDGVQFYQGTVERTPEHYLDYEVKKTWKSFSGLVNFSVK